MNKILGVTVIYYPDIDLLENIKSYLYGLDCLIIWENTPDKDNSSLIPVSDKIVKMGVGRNVGIGKALNAAAEYGLANGFDYLLTMDQDSRFPENNCKAYFKSILDYTSPAFFATNYNTSGKPWFDIQSSLKKIDIAMTSGSVYSIQILKNIGMFREDFFIDGIDAEISLRAMLYHIPILMNTNVELIHKLGNDEQKVFLGRHYSISNYPDFRLYYIYRNNVIIKRLYSSNFPSIVNNHFHKTLSFHAIFVVNIKQILLFEKRKISKIKSIIKGIIDGYLYKKLR